MGPLKSKQQLFLSENNECVKNGSLLIRSEDILWLQRRRTKGKRLPNLQMICPAACISPGTSGTSPPLTNLTRTSFNGAIDVRVAIFQKGGRSLGSRY